MAKTVDDLYDALERIAANTASPGDPGGGSSQPAPKQAAKGFEGLLAPMRSFAMGLLSLGTVLKGLSGTREGYLLDYSVQHLFFEIADSLRTPIRLITNELEGLARVINQSNKTSVGGTGSTAGNVVAGAALGTLVEPGVGTAAGALTGWIISRIFSSKDGQKEEPHLAPILKSSFGATEGLQAKMQQLSTENPAQERGLSLIEQCYNVLVSIDNQLGGNAVAIPEPAVNKDK